MTENPETTTMVGQRGSRRVLIACVGCLLLIAALVVIAVIREAPAPRDLAAELKALEVRLEQETAANNEAYRKACDAGAAKGWASEADREAASRIRTNDPAFTLLAEIRKVGTLARGTPTGFNALLKVIQWPTHDSYLYKIEDVSEAAREIVADYADEPGLDALMFDIARALGSDKRGFDATEDGLEKLIAKTHIVRTRAAASFVLARGVAFRDGVPKERRLKACDLLTTVQRLGEEPYASQAKEFAASHPRSQIEEELLPEETFYLGHAAPELEAAEDQDGKPFRLSDYRGKVVVLVFWGFW